MSALGLDIGTSSIRFVEAQPAGKNFRLLGLGSIPAPSKGIQSDSPLDLQALVEVIKKLLHDGGVRSKHVRLSLPESKVFTRVIEVPRLSEKELANSLTWEAEQYIPLPLEEVELDFTILRDITSVGTMPKQEVLLVAAPKKIIEKYDAITTQLGLEAVSMETDLLAASRACNPSMQQTSYLLIVMGSTATNFMILHKGLTVVSRSLEVAGNAFTRAISQEFNFELLQAEEYKKTYGLDQNKVEGKVYKALAPIFGSVIEEIKRSIVFYGQKFPDMRLTSAFVAGGGAYLPGLITALASELGIEAQLANPWTAFIADPKKFAAIGPLGPTFTVAAGLAMRE